MTAPCPGESLELLEEPCTVVDPHFRLWRHTPRSGLCSLGREHSQAELVTSRWKLKPREGRNGVFGELGRSFLLLTAACPHGGGHTAVALSLPHLHHVGSSPGGHLQMMLSTLGQALPLHGSFCPHSSRRPRPMRANYPHLIRCDEMFINNFCPAFTHI